VVLMIIFSPKSKECQIMNFEEFKQKAMQEVRSKNFMNLIDDWEKHIIHKDFADDAYGTSYYGTIYYADKTFNNELTIRIYSFSYHEFLNTASFGCTECSLYKEEIDVISKLSQCFDANKARFFDCTLDAYHGTGAEVK